MGAWGLGVALLSAAQFASAQEGPLAPFQLRLARDVSWDSNVLRLPDSAPDPQGRSDRITTTTIGAAFDQSLSQQRFVANVSQTAVRYNKLSNLDRDDTAYGVEWRWAVTSRIVGTLGTNYQESAVLQEDFTFGQRLVTTSTRNHRFSVDGWLSGGWHLLGGFSKSEYKSDQVFFAIPSTHQTNEELGLRYLAESGSSITATRRWSRGEYPGQSGNLDSLIDTGFKVRETVVSGVWIVSAQSTLTGRLTHVERNYDRFNQLDFSGNGGEIRYVWLPTGRLTINVSALRVIAPYFQTATSNSAGGSYRTDTTFAFAPSWQVSEKVNLTALATRLVTNYPGSLDLVAGPERRDTTRRLSAGAAWAAQRYLTLNATVTRERRNSNAANSDYDDTVAGVNVNLAF